MATNPHLQVSTRADGGWPPPPHDPRDRCSVYERGGWQVRAYAYNDPRRHDYASRGLLHLQLWHLERQISVLTPSQLTARRFELWSRAERRRLCCFGHLTRHLAGAHRLHPPCLDDLRYLETWLVRVAEIGAVARPR